MDSCTEETFKQIHHMYYYSDTEYVDEKSQKKVKKVGSGSITIMLHTVFKF